MGAGDKGIDELAVVKVGDGDLSGVHGIVRKWYRGPSINFGGRAKRGLVERQGVGKREGLLNVLCVAREHGVVRPLGFKIGGLIECAAVHGNDLVNQPHEVFRAVGGKHK